MYNILIKFIPKPDAETLTVKDATDKITSYWCALKNNGQAVGGYDIYENRKIIFLTTVVPIKDSINHENNGEYVKANLEPLAKYFHIDVKFEGDNLEYESVCECKKPSWYYLNGQQEAGIPLFCGDCGRAVSLYKVPHILGEKEHHTIVSWTNTYESIDDLWIQGLDDRYFYKQISSIKSKLNREGLKIRKALEKVLGAPTYLYLHYFYEPDLDEYSVVPLGMQHTPYEVCPKCGGELDEDKDFSYCRCCRIVADSPEFVKKGWEGSDSQV